MSAPKQAVFAPGAPRPIGPYSPAVRSGDLVFCSGQVGLDPATRAIVPGGAAAECRRAMENLRAVLEAAGLGLADVVKTTIYLVDMADYAAVNEAYGGFLAEPYPARATVAVAALPAGARVEVEAVARVR